MNSKCTVLVFLLLSLSLLCVGVDAGTYYVRSSATGSSTGADWTNAFKQIPSTLVRNSTYYVATGTYNGVTFDDAVQGTQLITIKKAIVAEHGTSVGWMDTYGIGTAQFTDTLAFSTGYYVIDGSTGGGPGSWETGFGFHVKAGYHVIDFLAVVKSITLKHMDIEGEGRSETSDTDLLYIVNDYTGITVSYCYLHDTSRTMILSWPAGGSGLTVEYSKFARNGVAEHREAWSAGTDSNVIVRNNLFEDIMGTGFIAIVNSNGDATNWQIYGNVFYHTGSYLDGIINTGVIMNRYDGTTGGSSINVRAVNWHIYNNVIANIRGDSFTARIAPEGPLDSYVVENNIWYNNVAGSGADGSLVDYNYHYANSPNGKSGTHDIVGKGSPFQDASPWLTGNWQLKFSLPGFALAAPYDVDPNGVTRGTGGSWDIGAYQFVDTSPTSSSSSSGGTSSSSSSTPSTSLPSSSASPSSTSAASSSSTAASSTGALSSTADSSSSGSGSDSSSTASQSSSSSPSSTSTDTAINGDNPSSSSTGFASSATSLSSSFFTTSLILATALLLIL